MPVILTRINPLNTSCLRSEASPCAARVAVSRTPIRLPEFCALCGCSLSPEALIFLRDES